MTVANKLKSNSKLSVQYNVDTCELGFKGERNTFNIPDATTAQIISKHGEVLDRYQNRINIIGKHHAHGLHVRTMNSGEKILVEGSPFAYKYGQNTYTSSNMKKAAFISLNSAFKAIGFKPSAEQKKSLKAKCHAHNHSFWDDYEFEWYNAVLRKKNEVLILSKEE